MLRDLPPYQAQPQPDIEIFMNTPGAQDEPYQPATPYTDPLDDVFGSAPTSPALNAQDDDADFANAVTLTPRLADHPSDVSRLRSTHVTHGYREGLAASKEQHIQEGFDEGYSLGAEIALKVGRITGALEGLCHALANRAAKKPVTAATEGNPAELMEAIKLLREAEEELKMDNLFSKQYFGEDGVWIYHVPDQENESAVTFVQVAEAHPIIAAWNERLVGLCERLGVVLG